MLPGIRRKMTGGREIVSACEGAVDVVHSTLDGTGSASGCAHQGFGGFLECLHGSRESLPCWRRVVLTGIKKDDPAAGAFEPEWDVNQPGEAFANTLVIGRTRKQHHESTAAGPQ